MLIAFLVCILLLAFLLLAAFYSGSETAMTSANRLWIAEQAKKGDPRAKQAESFLADGARLLGTVLIGNNLTHICLTNLTKLFFGAVLIPFLAERLSRDMTGWDSWLTALLLTPTVLIFGEAIPKAVGRNHADRIALQSARPLRITEMLLKPAVVLMGWLTRLLSPRPEPDDGLAGARHATREDMKVLAELAAEQGLVGRSAGEMFQAVLALDQRPVETAMVPLIEVRSLPETATVEELLRLSGECGFLHIPVFRGRVDRLIGIANCRELLGERAADESMDDFLRRPVSDFVSQRLLCVPESQPVSTTLEFLRQSSQSMAVVVDEYGGMTGVVTIEDLAELIVGNLNDDREAGFAEIQRVSPQSFLCSGRLEIRMLEECLGIGIPNSGFETAAGFVLKLAGKIPSAGEKYHFRQIEITVLQVEDQRITKLKFQSPGHSRKFPAVRLASAQPQRKTKS